MFSLVTAILILLVVLGTAAICLISAVFQPPQGLTAFGEDPQELAENR